MNSTLNIAKTKPIVELNNDQLIRLAPSIGATSPHAGASDRYSFVPTTKAIDFMRDAGWAPVEARESNVRIEGKRGFQRHLIKFARKNLDLGDKRLMVSLYNSHDAGSSFLLVGAVFRLVCSNGMTVSDKQLTFRHRHVGFSPDKFVNSAKFIAGGMERIGHSIEGWENVELEDPQKLAYAESAHMIAYDDPEKAPITPKQLLQPRRIADRQSDLWTTFNVVQENLIKGGVRGVNSKGRRMKTRAVKSLERDRKLNMALWTLTEKMEELKAA